MPNRMGEEVTERWGMTGSGHECRLSDRGECIVEIVRRRFEVMVGEEHVRAIRS